MKTKDFMSALSQIDEKYVQGMLTEQDAAGADAAVSAQDESAAQTESAAVQKKTAVRSFRNNDSEQLGSRMFRYLVLLASAAACIFGISRLMLLGRSTPESIVKDTLSVTTATTQTTESEQTEAAVHNTVKQVTATTAKASTDTNIQDTADTTAQTASAETEQASRADTQAAAKTQTNTTTLPVTTTAAKQTTLTQFVCETPPDSFFEQHLDASQKGTVVRMDYTGTRGLDKLFVYLPPGYDDDNDTKYNILYMIQPGYDYVSEDTQFCFDESEGNFDVMLDNMIANHEIEPMIVVCMRYYNNGEIKDEFWNELRCAAIPMVESQYMTYAEKTPDPAHLEASRYHRAFGGFSVCGQLVWSNMMHNLDVFAYHLPMSGEYEGTPEEFLYAVNSFNLTNDPFYIFAATGTDDIAQTNMSAWIDTLRSDPHFKVTDDFANGNLIYTEYEGGMHWWNSARIYAYNALKLFFRHDP